MIEMPYNFSSMLSETVSNETGAQIATTLVAALWSRKF
jgi:hypothetical protein